MSWFELIADRKIRDAQEEGRFDNLPGKGKPLNLDADLRVPPEQRLAYRLMREANILPDWIQLDKDVRRRHEMIGEKVEAFARAREQDRERLAARGGAEALLDGRRDNFLLYAARQLRELNAQIDRLNLLIPSPSRQRLRLNLEERMAELEERFPRLQPRPGGETPWAPLVREDRPPTRLGNRMPLRRKKDTIG